MEDETYYQDIYKIVLEIIGESKAEPIGGGVGIASPFTGQKSTPGGLPVTSHYGPRWSRSHNGIDISGTTNDGVVIKNGTPLYYNGTNGTVSKVITKGDGGGLGLNVQITNDDGSYVIFAHLSAVSVTSGTNITQGTLLGKVGNTGHSFGAHLHFEYRPSVGESSTDPYQYIDKYVIFKTQ